MVCSVCGTELKPGDKFCFACGTSVAAMNAAAGVQPEAPAAPQPQEAPIPTAAPIQETQIPTAAPVQETSIPNVDPIPEIQIPAAAPIQQEQPVYTQQVYAQPEPQAQPVYTQPDQQVQTMYIPLDANGQPIPNAQPIYAQPGMQGQTAYQPPVYNQQAPFFVSPAPAADIPGAKTVLILGIVALCLAISFFFSVGGIVCGAIALSQAAKILRTYGSLPDKVRTGKNLGKAGLIVGIVFSVISVFVNIGVIAGMIEEFL